MGDGASPDETQGRAYGAGAGTAVPDVPLAAPSFGIAAEDGSRSRLIGWVGVPLLIAPGCGSVLGLAALTPESENSATATEMGSVGWISEWASDKTGSARGRQISLYRPSMSMSDYRLEFLGQIESKSLGWVFRASDSRNYYVGKLELARRARRVNRYPLRCDRRNRRPAFPEGAGP